MSVHGQLAILLMLGGASPIEIPHVFHGIWVEEADHCTDTRQVRTIIERNGYVREEIVAVPESVILVGETPPRLVTVMAARAEGQWSWRDRQTWTLVTPDRLRWRTERLGAEARDWESDFVRCPVRGE